MRQYQNTPRSIRGQIKNLLRDSYRGGFAILKELVQNADDAGAKRLDVTLLPAGAGGVDHPLLDGPALVAVNDAKFDPRDEVGIMSLSESGKAGEGGTIGRFGLGMKSVFHLADAFFWLASTRRPGEMPRQADHEFNNPWADLASHADWCDPSAEQWADARRVVQSLAGDADPWFCLWLPIRTANLCRDGRATFPRGHEHAQRELMCPENGRRLAAALPLLKNLRSVRVGTAESTYELTLGDAADEQHDGMKSGFVLLECGTGERLLNVRGKAKTNVDLAESYRRRNDWPTHEGAGGQDESLPAKGSGAAFVIGQADRDWRVWRGGNGPTLDLVPAVYLPLDSGTSTEPADVSLVLHGEFFVDAGRQALVPDAADGRRRSRQNGTTTCWSRRCCRRSPPRSSASQKWPSPSVVLTGSSTDSSAAFAPSATRLPGRATSLPDGDLRSAETINSSRAWEVACNGFSFPPPNPYM